MKNKIAWYVFIIDTCKYKDSEGWSKKRKNMCHEKINTLTLLKWKKISKAIEFATSRMKLKVKFGLYMVDYMMCQCRFINCNKCTTLVGKVGDEGGFTCVGAGSIGKTSVLSLNFSVNL